MCKSKFERFNTIPQGGFALSQGSKDAKGNAEKGFNTIPQGGFAQTPRHNDTDMNPE